MNRKRLFLLFFGGVIFLILVAFIFTNLIPTRQNPSTTEVPNTASLSFDQNIVISESQTFDVAVVLDTGNQHVIGTDVVIEFDTNSLSLQNISTQTNEFFKTYTPIASDSSSLDTQAVINSANSSGIISFGALAFDSSERKVTGTFNGIINPLAVLSFQVKPTASQDIPPIKFRYVDSASITDSNVIIKSATGLAEDVLAQPTAIVKISTKAK